MSFLDTIHGVIARRVLLNYRIDRQISRGGFSIVYRAFDETGGPVSFKE